MRRHIELVVSRIPVRDADRTLADRSPESHAERVASLRRLVRGGEYNTHATLDAVARCILRSGDL